MELDELKIHNNFLSQEECSLIINECKQYLMEGKFITDIYNRAVYRNFLEPALYPIVEKINRFAEKEYKNKSGEQIFLKNIWLSIHKIGPGAIPHVDSKTGNYTRDMELTGLIYLNEEFSGGKLRFPRLKYDYSPKMGDLLLFPSNNDKYAHGVSAIENGVRYSIAFWYTKDPKNKFKEYYGEGSKIHKVENIFTDERFLEIKKKCMDLISQQNIPEDPKDRIFIDGRHEKTIQDIAYEVLPLANKIFKSNLKYAHSALIQYIGDRSRLGKHKDHNEKIKLIDIGIDKEVDWPILIDGKEYVCEENCALAFDSGKLFHERVRTDLMKNKKVSMLMLYYLEE